MERKIATRYNNPGVANDPEYKDEPSKTKQEFAAEADINTLLAKYEQTGMAPIPEGARQPIFGDFTNPALTDYAEAHRTMQGVGELMSRLPAKLRDRFDNDPLRVLQFVAKKDNRDEAIELGLINPPPPPPPAAPPPPEGGKK